MQSRPLSVGPTEFHQALLLFAALYAGLVWFGYGQREHGMLTIIWPSAGLLFVALWITPTHRWVWILVVQWLIELGINLARAEDFQLRWSSLFVAANSLDGVVGAWVARSLIADASEVRILNVASGIGAVALGAAASATLGAVGAIHLLTDPNYLHQWQIWWAGNWLGSLAIAPVAMYWAMRQKMPEVSADVKRSSEVAALSVGVLAVTMWIFSAPPSSITTLLQLPFLLTAFFVVVAFRISTRWAMSLAAGSVLLAAYYGGEGLGPFARDPNAFARVGSLQIFCASLLVFTHLLSVGLLEKRRTLEHLTLSEQRYRSFVALSSEAVWRIELNKPMPVDLPIGAQVDWLVTHAYVAEYNRAYQIMAPRSSPESAAWRSDIPWAAAYEGQIAEAARHGYSMDGLRYTVRDPHSDREYWAAFTGVIEEGRLTRIWGVAQDISTLAQTAARLEREQVRLRQYALDLSQAEERARRTTAVDLHDGISQLLFAMGINLSRVRTDGAQETLSALSEAQGQLHEVQRMVGTVIADLSPPGLYDLGLTTALNWLAHRHEAADRVHVTLDVPQPELDLNLDTRVFVFRLIRELLRNVVKHARTDSAVVEVRQSEREVHVTVSDGGVGVEPGRTQGEAGGFGLFSIRERVRSVGGTVDVTTAPGCGFRVDVKVPRRGPGILQT
jgi:signal transduction histidine kinase